MKTVRLAIPLVLAAFTLNCQSDQTTAPRETSIRTAPGGVPGKPPDTGKPGKKGGQVEGNFSMRFDGVQTHAFTPDADELDLSMTWTLEAWVKPTNVAGSFQHVVSKWNGGGDASYNMVIHQGYLRSSIHDGVVSQGENSISMLQDDTWQHVAVTFESGAWRFYINGVLDRTVMTALTPMNSTRPVSIGREGPPANIKYYVGLIDEVRIWNVARSQKQIDKNKDKEISPKSRGLVAYWRMNEGRGQILEDATGNGHDMQLGDTPDADAADPVRALKWESLASLPVPHRAAAAESDGSKLFTFGGAQNVNDEINNTQVYDPATNTWSAGAARDPVRAFNMAATLSDGVHVFGGFNVAHLNNHDVYDPAGDSWSIQAAMPVAIHAGTARAVDNSVYVMTGGRFSAVPLNQIYDVTANTWSQGANRPVEGGQFASAVIDGLVYVAGGGGAGGTVTHDAFHSYDPGTDSWQALASMPGPRNAPGGGVLGGQFCVFGGRTSNPSPTGARFAETFCYDPTTDTWSQGPDMITPRAEMASAELGNAIYSFGGRPMNDALHSTFAERLVPDVPF